MSSRNSRPKPYTNKGTFPWIRDGNALTLINSIRLDDAGLAQLDALGRVTNVVKIGSLHGRDDPFYKARYGATFWAAPGMVHEHGLVADRELTPGGETRGVTYFGLQRRRIVDTPANTLADFRAMKCSDWMAATDWMASRSPPPTSECARIDLRSEEGIARAFEGVRMPMTSGIAFVIHLAAYYDLSGEPSPLYEQITVGGTERLQEPPKEFYAEQFVFTSMMLVHAPTERGQRINEASPIDPRWPYPLSKVETEALIREKAREHCRRFARSISGSSSIIRQTERGRPPPCSIGRSMTKTSRRQAGDS